jgi:hypothetical protein
MTERRAPFYLRRTKEAMVYFPELQTDGSWVARKIQLDSIGTKLRKLITTGLK